MVGRWEATVANAPMATNTRSRDRLGNVLDTGTTIFIVVKNLDLKRLIIFNNNNSNWFDEIRE